MMEKSSKIYVAGHNGMVGTAITEALKRRGYTNIVGRTYEELNLVRQQETEDFFAAEKPEAVILCAAKVGGIMANNTLRAEFIYENLMIEANVIHAAWKNGVKKLVFLGSSCIYPRDAQQPLKEDYLLTSPLEYTNEPYAIAKIAGLKMCESYNLRYGTDFIAVMPTNLYGPYDNFNLTGGHVLPALTRRIHLGKLLEQGDMEGIRNDLKARPVDGFDGDESKEELLGLLEKHGVRHGAWGMEHGAKGPGPVSVTVWGTGSPLREFMWSGDMADATVFIMEKVSFRDLIPDGAGAEVRNTHINIGTGEEISIRDLAMLLKETIGFRGEILFNHSKPDGTPRKLIDSSKLHGLGFTHGTSIKEGVGKIYEWYRNSLKV
jgi:GDP-L-fucose synthase